MKLLSAQSVLIRLFILGKKASKFTPDNPLIDSLLASTLGWGISVDRFFFQELLRQHSVYLFILAKWKQSFLSRSNYRVFYVIMLSWQLVHSILAFILAILQLLCCVIVLIDVYNISSVWKKYCMLHDNVCFCFLACFRL